MLPALPADADRRRFVLAGGVGTKPVAPEVIDKQLAALLSKPLVTDGEILVICRVPGWAIAAKLVSMLRARHSGARVTEMALSRA